MREELAYYVQRTTCVGCVFAYLVSILTSRRGCWGRAGGKTPLIHAVLFVYSTSAASIITGDVTRFKTAPPAQKIWLQAVDCDSDGTQLARCLQPNFGHSQSDSCKHSDDIVVSCLGKSNLFLTLKYFCLLFHTCTCG